MKKLLLIKMMAAVILLLATGIKTTAQSGWELVYEGTSELGLIKGIDFVPGDDNMWQNGWAAMFNGRVLKTTDGGDTWTEIDQDVDYIWGIDFVDENIGFLASNHGQILKTNDGGETWSIVYDNDVDSFNKIKFKDADNGVAVGYPNQIYTNDGGATWSISTSSDNNWWGLDYAAGDTYWAVQAFEGHVGQTEDNGQNWGLAHNTEFDLTICVDFLDANFGIIGGGGSQINITNDGGSTWTDETVVTGGGEILAARWFDRDTLWACGVGIFKSTDGGANWDEDTTMWDDGIANREMFVTELNVVYASGNIIGDDLQQIWRKVGFLNASAVFEASETITCTGSTVDFTDMSKYAITEWEWTFEGGTPATSTEQNPSVTYENTGTFNVTLTVTNSQGNTGTTTMEDYIEVLETPAEALMPAGPEGICTGNPYVYNTPGVDFAQDYEWEVLPADAGELTWNLNEAYFDASDYWTGDFTIKVRANNICGEGPWSEALTVTISETPEVYSLQGGGAYCEGGEGVEITLDGSQTGVDYELLWEGDPTGQIVSGTNDAISFGNQTEAGLYEAIGFNENCETYMTEQVEVIVNALPTPEVLGLDMVCDNDVTEYETADNAGSTYTWEVTGGTITDGQGTYMVTIEWGEAGDGTVIVNELDENGCEATTEAFEVFIDDCTDISENGLSNELRAYPNPATEQLKVEFTGNASDETRIVIFNHLGQLVLQSDQSAKDGKQTVQFDVSNLRNGIYFIKVQTGYQAVMTKQIIKK